MTEIYSPYFGDFSRMNVIHFVRRGIDKLILLGKRRDEQRYFIDVVSIALYLASSGLAKKSVDQSAIISSETISIKVNPNPFNAKCEIEVEGIKDSLLVASICDINGRVLRELSPGTGATRKERIFTWDGKGDDGQEVGSGMYLVKVRFPCGSCKMTKILLLK